ncbi:hypothetical protein [Arthrobacter rhizosphaerae]|uniref:hypothetical protein n=1 Tax=Arthrobacter rhizosphaerae TaxID=2855490 RepID=UPI001FF55C16|nr:hypothetical protein [Arthrobacter rhizosphaerae]
MTILQPAAGIRPMDPLDVLARWRQRSMAADWRVEADWLCAGTRALATAFARGSFDPLRPSSYNDRFNGQPTAGQPAAGQHAAGQHAGKVFSLGSFGAGIKTADTGSLEPVRQLGAARAYDGVGIAEALTDVGALFSAHDLSTPMNVTAAFAEAWVEASSLLSVAISCTDPASGLSTWPHFRNRLYELYGAHEDVSRRFLLAVLRHPSHHGAGRRWELEARIGHICADNFARSGTVLSRAPDAVIVLSERTQDAFGRINSCAAELNILLTGQFPGAKVRIDVEPLPDDVQDVARLLDSLRR